MRHQRREQPAERRQPPLAPAAARALALQHAVGNRATTALIQRAPHPVTNQLAPAEAHDLTVLLAGANPAIDIRIFNKEQRSRLDGMFSRLEEVNDRVVAGKVADGPRVPALYADLLAVAGQEAQPIANEPWAVQGAPAPNGGRLEVEVRRKGHRPYLCHVSLNRHLIHYYWKGYADPLVASAAANTIAHCPEKTFFDAFGRFATALAQQLTARHYTNQNVAFNAQEMKYAPGDGPRFETDQSGFNVHAFCVETEGHAVTLDQNTHADFRQIPRGMAAPAQDPARAQGKAGLGPHQGQRWRQGDPRRDERHLRGRARARLIPGRRSASGSAVR
jgi:hypothetical protein